MVSPEPDEAADLLAYATPDERLELDRLLFRLSPERLGARRDLIRFCQYLDSNYEAAAHLRLIADKLAEVERFIETGGREGIGRLIINLPPRHGKSQTVSKRWPAFLLGRHPNWRIALISYGSELSQDYSRANRDALNSPEYQDLFDVRIHPASRAIDRWSLASGQVDNPSVVAVGVGGPLTGRGFHVILIDDPIKGRAEAESEAERKSLLAWYKGTLRTRLEPGGVIVLIQTRWHEADLAGSLIAEQAESKSEFGDSFDVLNLPALASTNDPLGREPGEALWPERYPRESLLSIQATSEYDFEAQYQGRPIPPGGQTFRRSWYADGRNRYSARDSALKNLVVGRWLSWDTGITDTGDSAFSVCTVGELMPDYRLLIRSMYRERLEFPPLVSAMRTQARLWNFDEKLRGIIIEDKASGTSAYQTIKAGSDPALAERLIAFQPSGSKEQRARQAAVWAANNCIWLPDPDDSVVWLFDFENELFNFPGSRYKDIVDSFSQLVLYLENLIAEGYRARGYQ